MAFTVTFRTSGPLPDVADLASWLTETGEPFEQDGPDVVTLRGLPFRIVHEGDAVKAQLDMAPKVPLDRVVRLVFDLSVRVGGDVRLAGRGEVTRPQLWLLLADEQDRLRLVAALAAATASPHRDEVVHAFWSLLSALGKGRDLRWDTAQGRIVELQEVGAPGGIGLEDAAWLVESAAPGDVIPVPVDGSLHILAWRWLSEAYPSLAEG